MIGAVRYSGQFLPLLYLDCQRNHLMPNQRLQLRQGYTVSQNTALCHVQVRRIVVTSHFSTSLGPEIIGNLHPFFAFREIDPLVLGV